jgi:DHA1 family bicyclomycin/chloramphenicol resistance-like MFS transporter
MLRQIAFPTFLVLMLSYIILAYLSVNILLPALPMLAATLHASAANIQLSVTGLLFGYGYSQFMWAVLSERYGARGIILIAISVTIIGSLISASAEHISLFISGRFIEGVGSGFGPVISRLMAKEYLTEKKLRTAFIYFVSVAALMPTIAPFIGGHILENFGWQAILYTLVLFCIAVFIFTFTVLKSEKVQGLEKTSLQNLWHDFTQTLKNRIFMAYYLCFSLITGSLITFYVMSPYLFIQSLHVSASQYSVHLIFIGMSYLVSANLHGRLINRMPRKLHILCGFMFVLAVVLELCIYNYMGEITVNSIVVAGCLLAAASGFINPTANTNAISSIKTRAAIPAAMLGSGIMLVSSMTMMVLAFFSYAHLVDLTILYSVILILAAGSFYTLLGFKAR